MLVISVVSGAHAVFVSAAGTSIDAAFREFFAAADPAAATKKIGAIVRSGVSFTEAVERVRRGRDYPANVPRGFLQGHLRTADGIEHTFSYLIPDNYDPSRPHQLRVQLHGGVSRAAPPDAGRIGARRLPGSDDEIVVFPVAWVQSMWWHWSQVDNLDRIVDRLKRTYNVDENRVYLTGVSDGGTGTYFMAFRNTTPWASFAPLIGSMAVLAGPDNMTDGLMFPGNAVNKPFFIVNAGRDPLYPAAAVTPLVDHLAKLGTSVQFRVEAQSDHNTAWWTDERARFEAFVDDHPREPLPDRISWETDRTDRYNRAHWLIIDRLGTVPGESTLPDSNMLTVGRELDFGLRLNIHADHGRRVLSVVPGSNAASFGLHESDSIMAVAGAAVESARDIFDRLQELSIGMPAQLTIMRGGQRRTVEGTFQPQEIDAPGEPIFPRGKPSGRVDLARHGNVVEARTHGVRALTLLLSPSTFDFRQPIRIVANGRTVFEAVVQPSVATLLKWAARDNDRTMVFGAELPLDLDK